MADCEYVDGVLMLVTQESSWKKCRSTIIFKQGSWHSENIRTGYL